MPDIIDIDATIEAIEAAARATERAAQEMWAQAERLREDKDLTRAAQTVEIAVNLVPKWRLDLLVTRPLRALGRA